MFAKLRQSEWCDAILSYMVITVVYSIKMGGKAKNSLPAYLIDQSENYSTVTDFARFLGLSISQPMPLAV